MHLSIWLSWWSIDAHIYININLFEYFSFIYLFIILIPKFISLCVRCFLLLWYQHTHQFNEIDINWKNMFDNFIHSFDQLPFIAVRLAFHIYYISWWWWWWWSSTSTHHVPLRTICIYGHIVRLILLTPMLPHWERQDDKT